VAAGPGQQQNSRFLLQLLVQTGIQILFSLCSSLSRIPGEEVGQRLADYRQSDKEKIRQTTGLLRD